MIIIIGYARTGTSILFKSLEAAGFNGGPNLYGHKHLTQDRHLKFLLDNTRDDLREYGGVSLRLARQIGHFFSGYCDAEGIDLIKSPILWETMRVWYDFCPDFKKAKFIWTRREKLQTAKSIVRVHRKFGWENKMTVRKHERVIANHVKIVGHFMETLNHIVVHLEDMVNIPARTFREISEFVGREVKPDLIDPKSTYVVNGEIN